MSRYPNDITWHSPHVGGFPITYREGDEVLTRDGRIGTVIGYSWENDLVIFQDGKPSKGFFLVTVDFEGYTENFLRHDLSGKIFANGGFI